VTTTLHQTGSGLSGSYTYEDSGSREYDLTGTSNSLPFSDSWSQDHDDIFSGTFTLQEPTPLGLQDTPVYGNINLAKGLNLLDSGFAYGDAKNTILLAASSTTASGMANSFSEGRKREGSGLTVPGPGGSGDQNSPPRDGPPNVMAIPWEGGLPTDIKATWKQADWDNFIEIQAEAEQITPGEYVHRHPGVGGYYPKAPPDVEHLHRGLHDLWEDLTSPNSIGSLQIVGGTITGSSGVVMLWFNPLIGVGLIVVGADKLWAGVRTIRDQKIQEPYIKEAAKEGTHSLGMGKGGDWFVDFLYLVIELGGPSAAENRLKEALEAAQKTAETARIAQEIEKAKLAQGVSDLGITGKGGKPLASGSNPKAGRSWASGEKAAWADPFIQDNNLLGRYSSGVGPDSKLFVRKKPGGRGELEFYIQFRNGAKDFEMMEEYYHLKQAIETFGTAENYQRACLNLGEVLEKLAEPTGIEGAIQWARNSPENLSKLRDALKLMELERDAKNWVLNNPMLRSRYSDEDWLLVVREIRESQLSYEQDRQAIQSAIGAAQK
jgi:hypothetical protein